jgi:hypothetical protein
MSTACQRPSSGSPKVPSRGEGRDGARSALAVDQPAGIDVDEIIVRPSFQGRSLHARSSGVPEWHDGPVPKPSRPTIYDVATRAGVSKSLVSLVLRDPDSVSERRRLAVLEAIEELGYRPSAAAASLAGTRTRTVGMVVEDFANLWFVDLLHGMREALEPHGMQVLMGDRRMSMASRPGT